MLRFAFGICFLISSFFTQQIFAFDHENPLREFGKDNDYFTDISFSKKCESFPPPLNGGFCIHTPLYEKNDDYVYYLHGLGGTEQDWSYRNMTGRQIRKEWSARGQATPTVISISFGKFWLLAEKNSSESSGLFEYLTYKVIPQIEARLGGLQGRRLLLGKSMGGVNSIQLALKTSLFDKVGILCAPLAQISPFASDVEIKTYAESTYAHQYYQKSSPNLVFKSMMKAAKLSKYFFPTPEAWSTGNPFLLLEKTAKSQLPRLYVSVGKEDEYGSFESTGDWVRILKNQGHVVDYRPVNGAHCEYDVPSIAQFLLE